MKKINKVKMSPLGTPLGNPLGYFNSLKGKPKTEPKQTLRKAQNGTEMTAQDIMDAKTQNTYNTLSSLKDNQAANNQKIMDSGNEFKNNLSKAFPKAFGQ